MPGTCRAECAAGHSDAVIYTTLEPREMCLGAIVISDVVNHVVFAMASCEPERFHEIMGMD